MQRALALYQTTIGKKAIVALTGTIMYGFVFFHMLGNLQIYLGPETINEYSAFLHRNLELIWPARIVLLVSVVAHVVLTLQLAAQNHDARPLQYRQRKDQATSFAARTMAYGGIAILLFIVYHLLHLTFLFSPAGVEMSSEDVYSNLVGSFRVWWLALIYIVAQLALGMHLFHGVWSMFQSLGLNHPRYNVARRTFATAFAATVLIGNLSIPLLVLSGVVKTRAELESETIDLAGPGELE